MSKKLMMRLSVVAVAVLCTFVMVACGSASSGYSKQNDLAKAYVKMSAKDLLDKYGEGVSFDDMIKCYYTANVPSFEMNLYKTLFDSTKSLKAEHDTKMKGNWVLEYNEDGTAKTKFTGEATYNGMTLEEYKKVYEDVKKTSKSYKFLESKKDAALTAEAAAEAAGYNGLIKAVEVWTIKYEYTPYTNGVAGEKVTVDHTESVTMVKIDGKWYLEILDSILGSIFGF